MGKANWWLWVFQNADSCCFVVEPGRDKDVVERFLGGVRPRVWISDRLGSQAGWGEKHQACLAHYADLRVMPTFPCQLARTAVIAAAGAA
ncbi:IS66 family transposase [Rhodopila globiformis]|uniref:IS66 family transposase n=1 Tax=Rhodopila globiformis TaxID=1071 RepID=UPI0038D169FD